MPLSNFLYYLGNYIVSSFDSPVSYKDVADHRNGAFMWILILKHFYVGFKLDLLSPILQSWNIMFLYAVLILFITHSLLCLFFSYCRCAIHSFILLCSFANRDNMFGVLVLVFPGKIASKYSTKVCKVFNI